jgi:hypothetical protein
MSCLSTLITLHSGPSFEQGPVHGDVFVRGQVLAAGLLYHLSEKLVGDFGLQQAIPIHQGKRKAKCVGTRAAAEQSDYQLCK